MFQGYNNSQGFNIPQVTKHLLIINVLLFAAGMIAPRLGMIMDDTFALYYWGGEMFNPAQLFTYMFMHGGISHLFFNMFALFMFGRLLEAVWGPKRFLLFYIVCGVGAGLVQELVTMLGVENVTAMLSSDEVQQVMQNGTQAFHQGRVFVDPQMRELQMLLNTPCVGASGAIFGILMGMAFLFPNLPMYIMFIPVPIKTKWMVLGYAVLEFFFGISGTGDGVAHFAHLGGLIFGLLVMYVWYGPSLFKGGARRM